MLPCGRGLLQASAGKRTATIEDGFRIEVVDGVIVLALYGVQDLAGEAELQIAAEELPESHRPIVVDLQATTYVDTAALAVLLNLRRAARRVPVECRFVLSLDQPNAVSRVLQVSQLDAVLPIDATLTEAVTAARRRSPSSARR